MASTARRVATCIMVTAVALSVVACDGGGSSLPDLTDPPVTQPAPLPTNPPTTSTTEAPTTTEATTTVAATAPGGVPLLSADGPWRLVDSAPGINAVGLTYELMPKLWVFLPTEVNDEQGYVWTFNETDRPVIEGYLMAMLTLHRSIDSVPATLDDEGWSKYYTADAAADLIPKYQERSDNGEYTDLDLGVVLQPHVIEDDRTDTYTIVLDCELDGAVRRNADGSYAEGATPGVGEVGYAIGMVFEDGQWKLDQTGKNAVGCQ